MPDWIVPALLALNLLLLLWLAWLASRPADQGWLRQLERLERELRDELGRQGQGARGDLAGFQQMLLTQSGDVARTQNEQIDAFRVQLATTQQQQEAALQRFGETLTGQLRLLSEANERRLAEVRQAVDARLVSLQAVSYTHLDVYKRQSPCFPNSSSRARLVAEYDKFPT